MPTQVAALPEDALADVFRGLPLRSLAVVRCVCKAWRDVVDGRTLLLRHLHLLPQRTVRGVFINYVHHSGAHLFARPCSPSTIPTIDGTLSFLPGDDDHDYKSVLDHCNGLLLCDRWYRPDELYVCNPATRQWTTVVLPRAADGQRHSYAAAYIVFDPAESPHYQVVLIPTVPEAPTLEDCRKAEEKRRRALLWEKEKDAPFCLDWFYSLPEDGTVVGQWEFQQQLPSVDEEDLQHDIADPCHLMEGPPAYDIDDPCRWMEWPPASWMLHVFSSRIDRWEERDFVREGMPAGTVEKMRLDPKEPMMYYGPRRRYAVYHHGSLYVHCRGSFVARLSLRKSKYQIIEAPENVKNKKPYLGKLHNGICFGIVQDHQLRIWILNVSCADMEWILKYEAVVGYDYAAGRELNGSWIVEESIDIQDTDHDVESLSKDSHEWDSDNDDTFTINAKSQEDFDYGQHLDVIGFHPHKEVVFMAHLFQIVAYHLNSSKIQYLGNSRPKCYDCDMWNGIHESFLYTPCTSMAGDMLHGEQTVDHISSVD